MKISDYVKAAVCVTALTLFLSTAGYAQSSSENPDMPIANGEHWVESSENGKLAYLLGIANTLDVEQAIHGDNQPSDDASLVPVMTRGLSGMTLKQIAEKLDRWYGANPGKLRRPVIETLWFEVAKPNS